MKNATLADRIAGFSKIRLGKATVNVPKLRVKAAKSKPKGMKDEMPISSIVNILIKNAVEKTKRDKKEKPVEEHKSYKVVKDGRELEINGGYGAVSKSYGMSPKSSYADYGKMFSHLGTFRAKQPYENMAEHSDNNKALDDSGFVLVSSETMEKGKFYIRYFNSKVPIAKNSLVPLAPGMSSKDWEEFLWFMRLDTAMYLLKISTS